MLRVNELFTTAKLARLRISMSYFLGISIVSFGGAVDIGLRRGVLSYLILALILLVLMSVLTWIVLRLISRLTKKRRNRVGTVEKFLQEVLRETGPLSIVRRKHERLTSIPPQIRTGLDSGGTTSISRNSIIGKLEEALVLDPENRDVRFQLMRWRGSQGDLIKARNPIKRLRRFFGYDVFTDRYWYTHLVAAVVVGVFAFVLIRINTEVSYYIESSCIEYVPLCADNIGEFSETLAVTRLNGALKLMPIEKDVMTSWRPIDYDTNCHVLHGGDRIGTWGGGGLSARVTRAVLETTDELTDMFLIAYYPSKRRHGSMALGVWGVFPPNKQRGWVIHEYSSLAPGGQSCNPGVVN